MADHTDRNRKNVLDLIEGITTGNLMAKFDEHYCETCVMSENGADDPARHGKDKNRQYEQYFVDNSEWHGVKIGKVLADGDTTAYEMWMDLSMGGQRMQRTQWAVQTWNDAGQITREVFHYAG